MKLATFVLFLLIGCGSGASGPDDKLVVFAAASLADVSQQLDSNASWNLAGSGTLARQIEDGAPCDVYLSANREWVDYLVTKNLAVGQPVRFAGNRLVLAAPAGSKTTARRLEDLSSLPRIGIADSSVPAGKYARQWLSRTDLNLITLGDVRSVARAIANHEVDAGFIYATDADDLKIVLSSSISVDYYALVIRDTPKAQRFVKLLSKGAGREALKNQGFAIND